ncbi:MAG TPA: TolC family protein [Mizugakiibacter sp.]
MNGIPHPQGTRALAALALLCTLAGCSPAPVRPTLDRQVPAAWREAPAPLGPAPDLHVWWRAFGDAELDRLVDAALADNLDIRAAGERLRAARALARADAARFKPTLGIATASDSNPDTQHSYFEAGFDAQWELGLFGRARSAAVQARADSGLAEADLQAARVSVAAEVARAWIALRTAQAQTTLRARATDAAAARVALLQTRARLRLSAEAEVARAEAQLAEAQAAQEAPRAAATVAAQQLAVLLGRSEPDPAWLQPAPPPRLGPVALAATPADLLRARPEIQHAEQAVLQAAGALGVARADLYPRLSLAGALTLAVRLGSGATRTLVSAGPVLDLPLFDWGARRARADAGSAALAAAEDAYRQAVLAGVGEVESALATLQSAHVQAGRLDAALVAQRRADAAAATLRRLGLADGLARGEAEVALLDAQDQDLDAHAREAVAFIALYKALGGAPPPLAEAAR